MLTGMQWSVQAQPPPPQSLFGDVVPATPTDPDSAKVELGTRFTVKTAGTVTAIRFYKGPQNTGTHVGKLYADGKEVARVTFRNETPEGWQVANLTAPVAAKPGVTYTTSYVALRGKYADDQNYAWPKVSGDLTAAGGYYKPNEGYPTQQWNKSNYYVDVLFAANVPVPTTTPPPPPPTTTTTVPPTTTTPPPTTTTEPAPPTTTQPTTPPGPAQHVPGGADGNGGTWPGPDNTGPAIAPTVTLPNPPNGDRVVLEKGAVIDGKIINNDVVVLAGGGTIRNSIVNGHIDADCGGCAITIEDSIVDGGTWQGPSVGYGRFTVLRSEIIGAAASLLCSGECRAEDSYMHGQVTVPGVDNHSSAFGSNGNEYGPIALRHNTLWCEAAQDPNPPFGGCTSDIAFIGDFAPVNGVTVDRNLLVASASSGYCSAFGWNIGKPYGDNPTNVKVTNNVVQRGPSGKCGVWGPDTSFKASEPTNVWSGNIWDDGAVWNHS